MSERLEVSSAPLAEVLERCVKVAREAGSLTLEGRRARGRVGVRDKGTNDLVTVYDEASERCVREGLARALEGYDLVGEEEGGEASGERPVFYLDPLDGTTNFAHGHPFYAVSLALCVRGRPVLAVVYAPALGWEFTAYEGGPALRNGEPLAVSETTELQRSLLATGFPPQRGPGRYNNLADFVHLKRRCQAIRRCGAASLDLCLVAEGVYDGYWERGLKPWDVAAGVLLVERAGGTVTACSGAPVAVRAGDVLATNGRVHGALQEALRTVDPRPEL